MHRVAAAVLAAALTGCRSSDSPTVATRDTTSTTAAATTTAPPAPPSTTAPATPPVSAPAPAERAYLTGVRVAATDGGGSRVVFQFDPVVPGYVVDYIDRPVTEDGSGALVTVGGAAVLQVRMTNAAGARVTGSTVVPTYTGPKRVAGTGTGGVAIEAVDTGDFEGQVRWAVGLRQKVPTITVTTLSGPSRLVIDLPAPTH